MREREMKRQALNRGQTTKHELHDYWWELNGRRKSRGGSYTINGEGCMHIHFYHYLRHSPCMSLMRMSLIKTLLVKPCEKY